MKLQNLLLVLISYIVTFSCAEPHSKDNENYALITGVFDVPFSTEVKLFKVEQGISFPVATSILNTKKEFGFAVSPEKEGFYIMSGGTEQIPIYLKGNQKFQLSVTEQDGYKMTTFPDKENEILYHWVHTIDTLKRYDFRNRKASPTTYKDYFPFYEQFIPQMKQQHDKVNSNNPRFNKLMHAYIDATINIEPIQFLFTPRAVHPKPDEMPDFYQDIKATNNFDSSTILDIPNGMNALYFFQMYKSSFGKKGLTRKESLESMFNGIKNDTLKGHFTLRFLNMFKEYNQDYLNFIEPLRPHINLSDYVKSEVEKFELTIKKTDAGLQGYPFTYNNQNGKPVSFNDFKGKYVYIDVWATWCSPCKKEIPHLKELEKELHGKDIQFVSISLDKQKDHGKWLQFIKENELTGIQLFSDDAFNTSIAKDYKINAIPRFLLFDKEGKIIDANAKRPSNPQLKQQLLTLLN